MADKKGTQLAIEFYHRPYMGREDFMLAECNFEAFRLIDSWPNWNYFAACIYGPTGCGKTHLSHIFSDKVSLIEHYPYKIPCIKAEELNKDLPRQLLEMHPCLIIEDLKAGIDEETLFHLYNMYRDEGGSVLFTAEEAPARIGFHLPDLRSRMNIVQSVAIGEPDDGLLSALLIKLFMDRQVSVSEEVIKYMLGNMQRSFSYARKLVEETDRLSLARKRAVSINIVKEAIENLNSDTQGELFDFSNSDGQGELFKF